MIHDTFRNLPDGKRQRIIESAQKELRRVPLGKARIANIVADAEISRGSFYQYFDTMDDVLGAVCESVRETMSDELIARLDAYDGDLFAAAESMFEWELTFFTAPENHWFIRNVLAAVHIDTAAIGIPTGPRDIALIDRAARHIDASDYLDPSPEGLRSVLSLLILCISGNLRGTLIRGNDRASAVEQMRLHLALIRRGATVGTPSAAFMSDRREVIG